MLSSDEGAIPFSVLLVAVSTMIPGFFSRGASAGKGIEATLSALFVKQVADTRD